MSTRKALAARALHQPSRRDTSRARRRDDANIAVALLHDNAEDNALVDAELCTFADSDVNPADIVCGTTRGPHRVFVALKHLVEREPGTHRREVLPGAGVRNRGSLDDEGSVLSGRCPSLQHGRGQNKGKSRDSNGEEGSR